MQPTGRQPRVEPPDRARVGRPSAARLRRSRRSLTQSRGRATGSWPPNRRISRRSGKPDPARRVASVAPRRATRRAERSIGTCLVLCADDDRRAPRGRGSQVQQNDAYGDEWDDPQYDQASYQDPYGAAPDPRGQGTTIHTAIHTKVTRAEGSAATQGTPTTMARPASRPRPIAASAAIVALRKTATPTMATVSPTSGRRPRMTSRMASVAVGESFSDAARRRSPQSLH